MYKEISLTHFRKHRDRTFTLTEGVNVIRGPNEEGKSTLLEALSYMVAGAKALRSPVERVVTYGEPPNSLSVSGVMDVRGTTFAVKRSPRGAEVTYDVGNGLESVTGQSGVTSFLRELQGATNPAAAPLAFISQRASRDILTGGTTATATLVDTLSGGGRLAEIIGGVKLGLVLGPTKAEEEALALAEEKQAELTGTPPPEPPEFKQRVTSAVIETARKVAESAVAQLHELDTALAVWKEFDTATAAHHARVADVKRQTEEQVRLAAAPHLPLEEARAALARGLAADEIAAKAAEDARRFDRVLKEVSATASVPKFELSEGTLQNGFNEQEALIQVLGSRRAMVSQLQARLTQAAAVTRALTKSGVCEGCGQDFSTLDTVAKFNAARKAEVLVCEDGIEAAKAELSRLEAEEAELVSSNRAITGALKAHRDALRALDNLPEALKDRVKVDLSTTPLGIEVAPVVQAVAPPLGIRALRSDVDRSELAERAEWRVSELKKQLAAMTPPESVNYPKVDSDIYAKKKADVQTLRQEVADLLLWKDSQDQQALQHAQALKLREERIAQGAKGIEERRSALEERKRNNLLRDTMHEMRPLAVARVWDAVLGLASRYFSELRGLDSVVSRAEDTFLVDGCHWEDLSVSAQDILGQSIRFALLKVFVPACDTIVLDEPTEAADPDRTLRLLVFLKSYGVAQVIMVSHDDVCDSVADNLIVL